MELDKVTNQPVQRQAEKQGGKGGASHNPPQFNLSANPIQQKAKKEGESESEDKKDDKASVQLKSRAGNPNAGANPNGGGNPIQAKMANEGAIQRKNNDDPLKVDQGQITFDAEGNDNANSRYFTRVLHWPGGASGVTIGRGYDLGSRTARGVRAHCEAAGITGSQRSIMEGGAGKTHQAANQYTQANKQAFGTITHDQQKILFDVVYQEHADDVVRLSTKRDVVAAYGETDFDNLHPAIMEIVVDLRYRGDYHSRSRRWIQPIIVANDLRAFANAMADNRWRTDFGVPQDRFRRRSEFMQEALRGGSPTLDNTNDNSNDNSNDNASGGGGSESTSTNAIGSGTVTASALNVRRGPGTNHGKVGSPLSKNQKVTVYQQSDGWYKIGEGRWASGKYINFTPGRTQENDTGGGGDTGSSQRRGKVTASALNVRKGPGSRYSKAGAPLRNGAEVTIYAEQSGWLKIGDGRWVYGKYIKEIAGGGGGSTSLGSGSVTASALNVRKGPGTNHGKTGTPLRKGAKVNILEEKNGWYRIGDNRWVSAKYVEMSNSAPTNEGPSNEGPTQDNSGPTTPEPTTGSPTDTGYVSASSLNVRSGPGPDNEKVGAALPRGAKVDIYEEQNGWLRIGPGRWVSGRYVRRGDQGGGSGNTGPKPNWISIAEAEIGVRENTSRSRHNPRVVEYHSTTGRFGEDETPWCASFVNWVMIQSGHGGNNSAWSQAWKSYGTGISQPAYGSIVVFDWGLDGGNGHVGFVVGREGDRVLVLGGNQGNMVKISSFAMNEIVAYRYPPGEEVPAGAYNLGGAGGPVADGGGAGATR